MNSQKHYEIVSRVIAYLCENARRQPSLSEIAASVNLSEYHLQRVFAAWAGVTPKRFLQYLNKEYALTALRQSADALTVSQETGLSGPGRLHDLMVSCEAMSPGEIKSGGQGLIIGYGQAWTDLGAVSLGWTERGICYLEFIDDDCGSVEKLQSMWPAARLSHQPEYAATLAQQIFNRTLNSGSLHLVLKGTNFQIKVWEALLRTEPGQLVSYGQLATMAGSPKAQRAVGTALAQNHIGYLIPCHRVIRENGVLGNYRWGTERKQALQIWERKNTHTDQSVQVSV